MPSPIRYCTVCCEEINLNRLEPGLRHKARRCQTCIDDNRSSNGSPHCGHCVHCRADLPSAKWVCKPLCAEGIAALEHPNMKAPVGDLPDDRKYARMTKSRPAKERRQSDQSRAEYVKAPTTLTESGSFLKAQAFPIEPKKRPRRRIVDLSMFEELRDKQ